MPTPEWLAEQFDQHRAHLRAVAYRMLGSASEAEDAVQESWIRLGRAVVSNVENLRARRAPGVCPSRRSGMTFEEIAPVVDRSAVAARQLASRARRRVQGQAPTPGHFLSSASRSPAAESSRSTFWRIRSDSVGSIGPRSRAEKRGKGDSFARSRPFSIAR